MNPDLTTTNALLAVMAAVSVLEAIVLAAIIVGGYVMYRRLAHTLARVEDRHIAPAAARVTAILDDVHGVTSVIRGAADSADTGMRWGLAWLLRRFRMHRPAA